MTSDRKKQLAQMYTYYTQRVPWHDQYMSYRGNEVMETDLRPLVDQIEPYIQGKTSLEIAAGTGNWTEILARRAQRVVATDAIEDALDIAAAKLRSFDNVEFRRLDAYNLMPLQDRFEVIFAADWYSHVPISKLPTFWQGLANVASDSGTVIMIDMTCKESLRKQIVGHDSDGNCLSSRTLPDGSTYRIIKNFPTADNINAAVRPYFECLDFIAFPDLQRWLWIGKRSAHDEHH